MKKIIGILETINEKTGTAVSWFTFFLVILICIDVLCRYFFNYTFIWVTELETYFFAIVFLLGAGYAFKHDAHVRVDVFYDKWSEKRKAWINLVGGLLLLLPWTIIVIKVSGVFAWRSFLIREGSAQPGGLPALYLLKFIIVLGFVFLLFQAIASILKSLLVIIGKEENEIIDKPQSLN